MRLIKPSVEIWDQEEGLNGVYKSIKVALVGGVTHGRIEQCPLLSEITDYDECWTTCYFLILFRTHVK